MVQKRPAKRAGLRARQGLASADAAAGALLLAALLQADRLRAEATDARTLLDTLARSAQLTAEEAALLQLAVALEAPQLLTEADLAAILAADNLVALGLTPELAAELLDSGVEQALQRLKAAFAAKIKAALASAERKLFGDEPRLHKAAATDDADADLGDDGEDGGGAAEAPAVVEPSLLPLALLAGAAGAVGIAVGAGGGGKGAGATNKLPSVGSDTIAAVEDTPVTFDLRSNDSDIDGDALAVTAINGTAISTTSPVVLAGVGTLTLNANGTLTFTPLANFNGAPSFTYTLSDGRGGTATGSVTLNVAAVNDAPVNSVPAAALAATQGVAVAVAGLSVADVDGGSVTTTLSLAAGQGTLSIAAVAGGATVSGSGSASVTLAGSLAQVNASLAALSFTPSSSFSGAATLTVATSDGTATDTDVLTINVARVQSGVVSDGYIAGGTVFIDVDGDGELDPDEPRTTTSANGSYAFATNAVGPVVAFGGTNIDTGLPNQVKLTAPMGSTVVNPLTTIVQSLVSTGVPVATATMQVAVALGLPAATDLGSYDILAKPATDPVAVAAQKAATQIVTLLNAAREAGGAANAAAVETAVVAKLAQTVMGGALDLTSTTTISTVLTGVAGIPPAAVAATVAKAAAVNQTIAKAANLGSITTAVLETSRPNVNLAPATTVDLVNTSEDVAVSFDVRSNDVDPEGAPLAVTAINGTAISPSSPVVIAGVGVVALNANGSLTFTPAFNFSGTPSFTYTVTDGTNSATGTVNLNVTPVADDPGSLTVTAETLPGVVANAAALAGEGLVELDVDGPGAIGALTISETQAATLIGAGLAFAGEDSVTVSAAATHLSNNLSSLQSLGVDAVAVAATLAAVDVDAGPLSSLSPAAIPQFDASRSDASLDVTLKVAPATASLFGGVADPGTLIAALGGAGVDHLDIVGASGGAGVRISDAEASALVDAGIDFADGDTIIVTAGTQLATSLSDLQALGVDVVAAADGVTRMTVEVGAAELDGLVAGGALPQFQDAIDVTLDIGANDDSTLTESEIIALAGKLGAANIDHLDVGGSGVAGSFELSDAAAAAMVAVGLDFAEGDSVSVEAAGTQLSTTLHDLQLLGADSVAADGPTLTVDLGAGIDGLAGLPQFDVEQSDGALAVTLEIGATAIADEADVGTLLGVDVLAGFTTPDLYGDLIEALVAAGIDRIVVTASGRVEVADGLADVLGALDGFSADEADLVLDATRSGDRLLTSLREMAELGVDSVELSDQAADPVYVDLGDGPIDGGSILSLLDGLDSDGNAATPLFSGSSEVSLVVDQATAEAIAQASSALDKLSELGFTQIAVLDGVDNSLIGILETAFEVKLIGQDDDLYDYLNP